MTGEILPAIAAQSPARVLFIGVRGYTRQYAGYFRSAPTEFWTCDIDPEAWRYGAGERHVTEDARRLDEAFPPGFFNVVLLNGIFGWGVDAGEDMERVAEAAAGILAPGGALLIGWNADRSPDPDTLSNMCDLFEPSGYAGLPHRTGFSDVTHIYAWYRLKPAAENGVRP